MGKYRMRGVKNTPKTLERDLLENAKRLAEDPSITVPKCTGDECRKCRFAKVHKKMLKVQRFKDDPDKLVKLASKGDQLVRAYAATISLAAAGKVPYLSTIPLPSGDVSFAVRGVVDKEKLVAMQHFDDPDLRLLAYWDLARKYDLHIYSTEKELYCSATGPKAPKGYVDDMLKATELGRNGCGHGGKSNLIVKWVSADVEVPICQDCLGDGNIVTDLSSRIAAVDHTDDFRTDVSIKFECKVTDCTRCDISGGIEDLAEKHRKGGLSDKEFLQQATGKRRSMLQEKGVYVLGQECYGTDLEAFLANIKGSEIEIKAISTILRKKPFGVVSDMNVASKIIGDMWGEHGDEMLATVASVATVSKVKERTDLQPAMMLAEASRMEMAKAVDCSLPSYRSLGDVGRLADSLARAFKTEGRDSLLRIVDKSKGKDHRSKSVCYAFLKAVGESSKSWQFSKQEADFGEYLSQFASKMLQACGQEYDDALKNLVTASGANEHVA